MHNNFFLQVVDEVIDLTFALCIRLVSSSENLDLALFKGSEHWSFNSVSFMVEGHRSGHLRIRLGCSSSLSSKRHNLPSLLIPISYQNTSSSSFPCDHCAIT